MIFRETKTSATPFTTKAHHAASNYMAHLRRAGGRGHSKAHILMTRDSLFCVASPEQGERAVIPNAF